MTDQTHRCRAGTETARCDFRGAREELREHADEVNHPRCVVCSDALAWHEQQTCTRCVSRVRDDLDAVAVAFAHLERVIGQAAYRGINWTALAMAGDGSINGGGEDDHVRYYDPLPPVAVLESWDRDWRETFGHRIAYLPLGHPDRSPKAVLTECLTYLRTWHLLAARTHPAFDGYAADLAELRRRLEHVVGLADDPVRSEALCFDCRGSLRRVYRPLTSPAQGRMGTTSEGLVDLWACGRCRREYPWGEYYLALRDRMEEAAKLMGEAS